MADTILLVCGSRTLVRTEATRWWATREILRALADLPVPPIVVHGGARGPDVWAGDIALAARCRAVRAYLLDGGIYARVGLRVGYWTETGQHAPDRWPLRRNAAMVAWVAAQSGDRRCLALVAPWSRTHSAGHTARLARDAGIATTVLTCPRELGPEEAP